MKKEEAKEVQIITLEWEKKDVDNTIINTSGIYQIYGDSPIYGTNVLLYIGQAAKLGDRLSSHFNSKESFIGRQPNKTCRFASVDDDMLDIVEQILIVMHKPSFNSSNIIEMHQKCKEKFYIIHNHGERGVLSLEVSNYYFLDKRNVDIANR